MAVRWTRTGIVLIAVGGAMALAIPSIASAAPGRAQGITLTRAADDPHQVKITWQPVAGTHHYNVSVFDGASDTVTVVDAPETSATTTQNGACTRLRVNIATRDTAGKGSTSANIWLNSLAPGGISDLHADRDAEGTRLTAAWKPPSWSGHGTLGAYKVELTRSGDKAVVFDGEVTDPAATFTGLDPTREYTLAVTTRNAYGSCSTGKLPIGTTRPGAVASLKAVRDKQTPSRTTLSWEPPSYKGRGAITGYRVGYGIGTATDFLDLDAGTTETTLDLDPKSAWFIQVQAVTAEGPGRLGSVKLPVDGASTPAASTTTDFGVTMEHTERHVVVRLAGKIDSNVEFPKVVIRVRPVADNGGFVDEQWGQNGAQTVRFGPLPTGFYTVTVSGMGSAGEVEWVRRLVNIGDAGVLARSNWRTLRGDAEIGADTVAVDGRGGPVQLVSATQRTTGNAAFTSTVTVKSGPGLGVLLRASGDKQNKLSGYLVEITSAASAGTTGSGPWLVLRSQSLGKACSTPIAVASLPKGLDLTAAHRLMVVVNGDGLYATVDDAVVLDVASLVAATPAQCDAPAQDGSQIGLIIPNKTVATLRHSALN